MNFSELKQNYPVYMLISENDKMHGEIGKVVNVSQPRFAQLNPQNMNFAQMPLQAPTQRVIDVTIQLGDKTQTYTVNETSSISNAQVNGQTIVLSPSKEAILREVDALKTQSTEALSMMDKHKNIIAACDDISVRWNPEIAKEKDTEKRLENLEKGLTSITSSLAQILEKIDKPTAK